MGGRSSGKRDGRPCTDDMIALDIRWCARNGYLEYSEPGALPQMVRWQDSGEGEATKAILRADADTVLLTLWQGDGGRAFERTLHIKRTTCNFGGTRLWWRCPRCSRRVAILFLARSAFMCRHCHGLAHRSQRETGEARVKRRVRHLRRQLGWTLGIFCEPGGKPKGMHWKTYFALRIRHDAVAIEALQALGARIDATTSRIAALTAKLPAPLRRKVQRVLLRPPASPTTQAP